MSASAHPPDDQVEVAATVTFAEGTPGEARTALEFHPGDQLGRYQVTGNLGEGGMGIVLSAYDPELDRRVAIKLVRAGGSDATDRLLAEARAMARVSHENVVVVHDVGTIGERLFVAMELVDGETLTTWQTREREWARILPMYVRAGRGLAAAHAAGLVHRDFKPSNVLVGLDGRVRVSDFGLATAARDRHPDLAVAGTPLYMAPEQHSGEPVSASADQFSFCASLWEALYGQPPFAGTTVQELRERASMGQLSPPPPASKVPSWLEELLRRGLAANSGDRFASMEELLGPLAQRGPRDRLAGIWDEKRALALEQAFEATGRSYAAGTAALVRRRLDDYAARWVDAHESTFQASHVRGEVSPELLERRMVWLAHRLDEVRALVDVFVTEADGDVLDAAVYAVGQLQAPEEVRRVVNRAGSSHGPLDAASEDARATIDRATALERAGKYAEGLALAADICERAEEIAPGVALAARLAYGRLLDHVGRFDDSSSQLRRAATDAAKLEDDLAVANSWTHLVWVLGNHQARHDAAETLGWAAAAAVERAGDPGELRGDLQNNLGSLEHARGRYEAARSHHERALSVRRRAAHPDPGRIAWSLNNLATVVSLSGDYDRALALHEECLALREETLGPDHPDVAVSLLNLGCVFAWRKEYERELDCFARAVDITERALGPGHFKVGMALHNQGDALAMLGDFEPALAAQERALDIFEQNLGLEHILLAFVLTAAGECLLELERPDEALAMLERADGLQEHTECDAAERGKTLFALARARQATGGATQAGEVADAAEAVLCDAGDHGADRLERLREWRRALGV